MNRIVAFLLLVGGCSGTTGDNLVVFSAAAAGPADLPAGGPLEFDTPLAFHVRLDRARLHIGAAYLNQTLPVSGAQETSCVLPGVYVGEVVKGLDVDLLSSRPQPFPVPGEGNTLAARAGELWLTGGDVAAEVDNTRILDIAGVATRGGSAFPFEGTITISKNRAVRPPNAAVPGGHPICKERIVTPIPVDFALGSGGTLIVRADPRRLFTNVDFSLLQSAGQSPPLYRFDDTSSTNPSLNLYQALHAAGSVYRFEWVPHP